MILIAPDKFKGSLTSAQAASLIAQAFENHGLETTTSPLADGGEGTVDSIFSATGGQKEEVIVNDPLGRPIKSFIGLLKDKRAVIEMASASGLYLLKPAEYNPLKTSTFGTGQLIKAAMDKNAEKILIGVGGSATNDGGMGAATALGARFLDSNGVELEPIGKNLVKVKDVDLSALDPRVSQILIEVAVDVDNPFYGPNGAAYVYAPQKGADKEMVKELDEGLRNLADVVKEKLGLDLEQIKGGGAAGGLAGGLVAFLGAKIKPGTKYICQILGLDEKAKAADFIITGEGRVDEQTLHGKAPTGVIDLAKKYGKRVFFIAGQLGEGYEKVEQQGVKIYTLNNQKNPGPAIEKVVDKIISDLKNPPQSPFKKGEEK